MKPEILFRIDADNCQEFDVAQRYFRTITSRAAFPTGTLVIGRYSVLPYYEELDGDLCIMGCELINSTDHHNWIANFEYYDTLKSYTFPTWTDDNFYLAPEGPYVVKGKTNSRKHQWNSLMFAENKKAALSIASDLMNDSLIGPQGVIYRKYIPLETFEVGLNGLPFTNEWRFFYYQSHLLSYGYYWTNAQHVPKDIDQEAIRKASEIARIACLHTNFFVLDLGKTNDGEWILIEVNDGQMSGLSYNDPRVLYSTLASHF